MNTAHWLKNISRNEIGIVRNGITRKITLLAFSLIISSIIITGIFNYISQQSIILERMKIEADNVTESIIQAHSTSLFTENYEAVIEFCLKLVKSSSSIDYVVITKLDGSSLIFKKDSWNFENLGGHWRNPGRLLNGAVDSSIIAGDKSYRFAKPFVFTGIEWGFVHIGISLDTYNTALETQIWRIFLFSGIYMVIGLIIIRLFSGSLNKPVNELVRTTREIASGNLSARARIVSNDDLGILAKYFNSMAETISKNSDTLAKTVQERTLELKETNSKLICEMVEKEKAQNILQQYTVKIETLEQIYRGIIGAETTRDVFYQTIEIIHEKLVKFSMALLCLYDFDDQKVLVRVCSKNNDCFEKKEIEYELENFSKFDSEEKREFYIQHNLHEIQNKTSIEEMIFSEARISHITFPLYQKEELIGELVFAFDDVLEIDDDKLFVLVEISHHFSVAVIQLVLENKLKVHTDELKKSVAEKEILLSEIHHRVKNNLQIISSFLFLQSRKINDDSVLSIFKETQSRVKTLALVHEKLYKSSNLSSVDFSDYIKNLFVQLKNSYCLPSQNVLVEYDLEKVSLPIDMAVPVGLILNELLTNSFKYAFADGLKIRQNIIGIKFKSCGDGKTMLVISDNGIGLPDKLDLEKSESLGLKIVHSLVAQINGDLQVNRKNNTEFKILFSKN